MSSAARPIWPVSAHDLARRRVILEEEIGSSQRMVRGAGHGGTFEPMLTRARRAIAGSLRLDPRAMDVLAALALIAAVELQVWLSKSIVHRAAVAIAGAVVCSMVSVRRRWPFEAMVVPLAAVIAQELVGGRLTQHAPGALLAIVLIFYGTGAYLDDRRAWLAISLGVAAVTASVVLVTGTASDLAFAAIFLQVLPWAAGRIVRERGIRERVNRERAERVDAEREQHALAAVWGERARIARELHDVITHSVSVMVIQAGGARMVMDTEPKRAEASLLAVERAGREALAEMRRLVGLLDDGSQPRAPQPGLADMANLIAQTRSAGLPTSLRVDGQAVAIAPALELCAYRIVQEALTNAIKHAGPAHADVRVRWTRHALELEIHDNGTGPPSVNGDPHGHGIVGMRERAAMHGGTVEAGAHPSGGFCVEARLPLTSEHV